ncbi:MAG TPA: type II toxin-antitoxin system Phd/YefM family antitoxin [Methylocystis sp.]|nr:type II toxin-antitoxin system Phd/YefM family antitoxin [Methylocystis sp.]
MPAAEFTRNFGRYRMLAQKGAVPVTSHGTIAGYFVPPEEYEELERYRAQRRSFATRDLPAEKVREIAATRMDPRHDHLDALLDPE